MAVPGIGDGLLGVCHEILRLISLADDLTGDLGGHAPVVGPRVLADDGDSGGDGVELVVGRLVGEPAGEDHIRVRRGDLLGDGTDPVGTRRVTLERAGGLAGPGDLGVETGGAELHVHRSSQRGESIGEGGGEAGDRLRVRRHLGGAHDVLDLDRVGLVARRSSLRGVGAVGVVGGAGRETACECGGDGQGDGGGPDATSGAEGGDTHEQEW